MDNKWLYLLGGLAAGYVISGMMAPAAKVGAFSLPCECSTGGVCNSGKSDCSCCPNGYGHVTTASSAIPIQFRRTVGL